MHALSAAGAHTAALSRITPATDRVMTRSSWEEEPTTCQEAASRRAPTRAWAFFWLAVAVALTVSVSLRRGWWG